MFIVRWFFTLLILAALAFGAAYYYAGTLDGPVITINQPSVIGQGGTLDVTVDAPGGELTALDIQLEQKGRTFPILDLASAPAGAIVTEGDRVRITRPIGKKALPELENGPATVKVSASRPGLPQAQAGLVRSVARGSGPADASASRGRIDASLRQSGRRGNGRLSRHRRQTSNRACVSATSPIPDFPGSGARASRSRAEGGVLRAALQPARRCADGSVRARHRGQPGARAIRASRVSEEIPQQPDSARRQVSRRASCRRFFSRRRS